MIAGTGRNIIMNLSPGPLSLEDFLARPRSSRLRTESQQVLSLHRTQVTWSIHSQTPVRGIGETESCYRAVISSFREKTFS